MAFVGSTVDEHPANLIFPLLVCVLLWYICNVLRLKCKKKKKPLHSLSKNQVILSHNKDYYWYGVCMGHGILWSAVEKKIVITNGKLIMPVSKQW